MAEEMLYSMAVVAGYGVAMVLWPAMTYLSAPYGRHKEAAAASGSVLARWALLPSRWAWFLMECPTLFLTPLVYSSGRYSSLAIPRFFISLFTLHYLHRVLIYPLRIQSSSRNMPLAIILAGFLFNVYNAYVQGRGLSHYNSYGPGWERNGVFVCGVVLFGVGMAINVWADSVLIGLRRAKKKKKKDDDGSGTGAAEEEEEHAGAAAAAAGDYTIPRGGLFEFVTCPNYLGEIVEWLGWGLATWSWSGFLFALLTAANLVPRAMAHHRWYHRTFPYSYPASRKILIPFLF